MRETGGRLRLLLSYHYFKKVDLDKMLNEFHHPEGEVFADCGAFSAMTTGAEITIDDYAAWLKKWRHWFGPMANFDVIGNAAATAINQKRLEDMGLPVLPVFHTSSAFDELDRLATQYDYIALGGMVGKTVGVLANWVKKCHAIVGNRSRFHGFGMTSWPLMLKFPWRSVDSSSWGQGHRYGMLSIFDPISGQWRKFRIGTKEPIAYARIFRQLGCEPLDFVDRRRYHATKAIALSIRSWAKAAEYLSKKTQYLSLGFLVDGQTQNTAVKREFQSLYLAGNTEYTANTFQSLYLAGDTEFQRPQRRPACAKAFREYLETDQ